MRKRLLIGALLLGSWAAGPAECWSLDIEGDEDVAPSFRAKRELLRADKLERTVQYLRSLDLAYLTDCLDPDWPNDKDNGLLVRNRLAYELRLLASVATDMTLKMPVQMRHELEQFTSVGGALRGALSIVNTGSSDEGTDLPTGVGLDEKAHDALALDWTLLFIVANLLGGGDTKALEAVSLTTRFELGEELAGRLNGSLFLEVTSSGKRLCLPSSGYAWGSNIKGGLGSTDASGYVGYLLATGVGRITSQMLVLFWKSHRATLSTEEDAEWNGWMKDLGARDLSLELDPIDTPEFVDDFEPGDILAHKGGVLIVRTHLGDDALHVTECSRREHQVAGPQSREIAWNEEVAKQYYVLRPIDS